MTEKILFDTDIGSDIDDAVCLAYLLMKKECELVGITTVTGESAKRAMMADAMCRMAGKAVPVCAGSEEPLIIQQKQKVAPQAEKLINYRHADHGNSGDAVGFMRDIIYRNPGEITLLAVGPLTNVALLFASDRKIPHMLKRLVMMCGSFGFAPDLVNNAASRVSMPAAAMPASAIAQQSSPSAANTPVVLPKTEWNAKLDPHATRIVYQAPVAIHRSVGLDVTLKVRMDKEAVLKNFRHKLLMMVADFAEVWFARSKTITFHDPLAAAGIFNDGILEWRRGNTAVSLGNDDLSGATAWSDDISGGKHEAAAEVDCEGFFSEYFSAFD